MLKTHSSSPNISAKPSPEEKILLMLLPFWTPLIPPLGISTLKEFLRQHGYNVKTVDANVLWEFKEIYDDYFEILHDHIPGDKQGNLYNIGNDVLRNHMMVHRNSQNLDQNDYIQLVKELVVKTFYHEIPNSLVLKLDRLIEEFYTRLETYILELLEQEKPTILGISTYSGTMAATLHAFEFTKKHCPQVKTVIGGGIFAGDLSMGSPNFDFFLEKSSSIDKIIIGEGELLLLAYLQNKLPASRKVITREDIKGEILDIDSVPGPDYSDWQIEYYPVLAAHTSRSCPFQCGFCSETVFWGKYRKKKTGPVVEELKYLCRTYNTQLFLLTDSLLNPIISDLARELIDTGESIYWDGYLRADRAVCDTENTLLWRRGGFYRARLGLESGSPRILKAMNKKIMPQQIKTAVSALAYAGIKTTTYWVIGYPGETEADFQQTLDLIEELKDDIYETDCNTFNYFISGQINSNEWAKSDKQILLYPEKAKEMLLIQTWILDGQPSRAETYRRLNRFVQHCKKLRIPNPYSLADICRADERWKKLHKNSVPPLLDFLEVKDNNGPRIEENKQIKKVVLARNPEPDPDPGGWGF
jgi:radical SAM superfamily enzyme YgiQ (UPF0313 family)